MVINAIAVKTINIEQAGKIIDTAVQNGANQVSNIHFTVANEQAYYQQALSRALENAVAKAQTISRTMQLQLEPQPIKIIEQVRRAARCLSDLCDRGNECFHTGRSRTDHRHCKSGSAI